MDQLLIDANSAYQNRKYKKALETYREASNKEPKNALAHQGLAQCLYRLGKYNDSFIEAHKALEIDNSLAISHWITGVSFKWKKQYPDAEAEFRKSLELDPNMMITYILLGTVLSLQHKFQEAVDIFSKAIALDANSWVAHYYMSSALQKQKKSIEGIKEAKTAYSLHHSIFTGVNWGLMNISLHPYLYLFSSYLTL